MPSECHLDYETRSTVDLQKAGAYAYFDDPTTDVWCAAYSFDDEDPELWLPGEPCPPRLIDHVREDGIITAWNASFERLCWQKIMGARHGWPAILDRQFRCTMTEALGMNMPGKLEKAAVAFGINERKDEKGHRIMMQMCKPRKIKHDPGLHWWEDHDKKQKLYSYCLQDVRVEASIGTMVMRLRPKEEQLYFLDMKINDRGVYIDAGLCRSASAIVESAMERLDVEMHKATDGVVGSCSQVQQLTLWLKSRGIETESVDREHIEDLLIRDDIPDDCRRALELRQEGSKTSTSKINAMLRRRQADGRMRGNLQFYGASATGRWAARGAQLQNLTRPVILGSKKSEDVELDQQIENAIAMIHGGSSVYLEIVYGRPLTLIADTVRSMICSAPGNVLRSSDFSNIEGRLVAWLAGQEDKLDVFRAYDSGDGPDPYLVTAGGIYNVAVNEAKPHRQIGKVAELSLGYQGGPRAFAKMAKNYGVRIAKLYGPIWEMTESGYKDQALQGWKDRGKSTGLSKEGWLAAEVIKLAWRAKHWAVERYWSSVEAAAIAAVREPGTLQGAPRVKFKMAGRYLFCLLPSGRALCYPYPRLRLKKTPWGEMREQVIYRALDQFTKKWTDKAFYGGLGVENITQAVARDVMAEAMLRVEDAGYKAVLTVHDEIVTENKVGFGSLNEFNAIMQELPKWATGLPLTVSGWEGERYRKG